jgi:thioester reductase-like protein
MPAILLTGFPGFLASRLAGPLLDRTDAATRLVCLVQDKYRARAERRVAKIVRQREDRDAGRIELMTGDIAEPDLALGARLRPLQQEITEIYHLAAVYDLTVSREVGTRVNVEGTRHMLHVAESCSELRRFQYVSTCYVSGRYGGLFTEDDLQKGQRFNNYYEETKYRAEVAVQRKMDEGLPATVYRPGIVVGDSETGATQKYDGPYPLIQWMLRWDDIVPMPALGDPATYTVNVVPCDFVVDAIAHLSGLEASEGRVYQFCDPHAPTVEEFLDTLARAADRRFLFVPVVPGLARLSLQAVPGLAEYTGFLPDVVDYFTHPTTYNCRNVHEDLKGTGIACPPLPSYAHRLVDFMREHPDLASETVA